MKTVFRTPILTLSAHPTVIKEPWHGILPITGLPNFKWPTIYPLMIAILNAKGVAGLGFDGMLDSGSKKVICR